MFKGLIFIFLCCSTLGGADFEQRSIETLALTFQSFEEKGGDPIWPGFKPAGTPAVFHFNNGHVYAFGLKGPLPLWEKRFMNHYPFWYCPSHPASLVPLDPTFRIENQQAFVFCLDHGQEVSDMPLLTFVHERFHLHQFQYFQKGSAGRPMPSDYQTVDQLAWMELENRLLSHYLKTDDRKVKMQCLKDFIAVNKTRRLTMHAASVRWEDHQQMMEGLADYVSVKAFQTFSLIPSFKAEETLLEMREKKTAGNPSLLEDGIKGRHYFVGATLALALDDCGMKDWKKRMEAGSASLQQLLEISIGSDENGRRERAARVKQLFNWAAIRQNIALLLDQEQKEREQMASAFAKQEGVVINIGIPSGHMSAGGRHAKSCALGHGRKILVEDMSTASSEDQSWMLSFKKIPFVIEGQKGDRQFKMKPEAILQVDGNPMTLKTVLQKASEKELSFSCIAFQTPFCELSSTRPGKITGQGNSLSLVFD